MTSAGLVQGSRVADDGYGGGGWLPNKTNTMPTGVYIEFPAMASPGGIAEVERFVVNIVPSVIAIQLVDLVGGNCGDVGDGILLCGSSPITPGNAGLTIGNVIITGRDFDLALADSEFINHEKSHSSQWAIFGSLTFLLLWGSAGGPSCGNWLEEWAGPIASSG